VKRYGKYGKKSQLNSEKIWEIQKKGKLNSEKIWKTRKKSRLNSKMICFRIFHIFSLFSSIFSISFHNFLPHFQYLFTIQLGFLPYFDESSKCCDIRRGLFVLLRFLLWVEIQRYRGSGGGGGGRKLVVL
jgi:hypothetical protein